jgi:RHH-type transcriptional regulator, rel operon repressor / antitoxin RelB
MRPGCPPPDPGRDRRRWVEWRCPRQRLDALAKASERSKASYLQEAIVEYLSDLEDFYLAEQRLAEIKAGRAGTVTLAEVERDLGLAN